MASVALTVALVLIVLVVTTTLNKDYTLDKVKLGPDEQVKLDLSGLTVHFDWEVQRGVLVWYKARLRITDERLIVSQKMLLSRKEQVKVAVGLQQTLDDERIPGVLYGAVNRTDLQRDEQGRAVLSVTLQLGDREAVLRLKGAAAGEAARCLEVAEV